MYEKELKLLNSLYVDGIRDITKINKNKIFSEQLYKLSEKFIMKLINLY